jgi:peroxiredoxin
MQRFLAVFLVLSLAGLSAGSIKQATSQAPVSGDTTAVQLKGLRKEVEDAKATFYKALAEHKEDAPKEPLEKLWLEYQGKLEVAVPKALELARKIPNSESGFEALEWIVRQFLPAWNDHARQAVELLKAHHAENPKAGPVCAYLGWYDSENPATMSFLKVVAEKNPDRTTRGQATLALARLTNAQSRYFDLQKKGDPLPAAKEAEKLFETVIEKYGDCLDLRSDGGQKAKATLGAEAKRELFAIRHLAIGKVAPEIDGEDLEGQKFKLSDHRGKVVVLTFWATWCSPCMAMVPHEREMVEKHKDRPFVLLGVNGDDDQVQVRKVVEKEKINWRSFKDGSPNGPICDAWNIQSWPMVYVIDANGVIRLKHLRDQRLDEMVEKLLKEIEKEKGT